MSSRQAALPGNWRFWQTNAGLGIRVETSERGDLSIRPVCASRLSFHGRSPPTDGGDISLTKRASSPSVRLP